MNRQLNLWYPAISFVMHPRDKNIYAHRMRKRANILPTVDGEQWAKTVFVWWEKKLGGKHVLFTNHRQSSWEFTIKTDLNSYCGNLSMNDLQILLISRHLVWQTYSFRSTFCVEEAKLSFFINFQSWQQHQQEHQEQQKKNNKNRNNNSNNYHNNII